MKQINDNKAIVQRRIFKQINSYSYEKRKNKT